MSKIPSHLQPNFIKSMIEEEPAKYQTRVQITSNDTADFGGDESIVVSKSVKQHPHMNVPHRNERKLPEFIDFSDRILDNYESSQQAQLPGRVRQTFGVPEVVKANQPYEQTNFEDNLLSKMRQELEATKEEVGRLRHQNRELQLDSGSHD